MSEHTPVPGPFDPPAQDSVQAAPEAVPAAAAPAAAPVAQPAYGAPAVAPAYGAPAAVTGGPGKIRGTGMCILLAIVTFGIYTWVWYFSTSEEMKRHSGQGLGGAVSLVLAIFVGIVSPFISSSEVGGLYERAGRPQPVSGATGLWYFPGIFILVGPIVWFVKTNGALNDYWKSLGAQG